MVEAIKNLEAEKAAAAKKAREKAAEEEKKKSAKPMGAFRAIRDAARPANLLNGTTTTRSA